MFSYSSIQQFLALFGGSLGYGNPSFLKALQLIPLRMVFLPHKKEGSFLIPVLGFEEVWDSLWNLGPPSLDPVSRVISSALVWFRLPNLPLHLWNLSLLTTIRNERGNFYCWSLDTHICWSIDYVWV